MSQDGALTLRISKPGGLGILALIVVMFFYEGLIGIIKFTLPYGTYDILSSNIKLLESESLESGHPRRSGP
eukprot:7287930-Pyramimonas_sp.AAC.1